MNEAVIGARLYTYTLRDSMQNVADMVDTLARLRKVGYRVARLKSVKARQ